MTDDSRAVLRSATRLRAACAAAGTHKAAAAALGVSPSTLSRWARHHGIEPTRTGGTQLPRRARERLSDGLWLRRAYVTQRRTLGDIAGELGVSTSVVGQWLRRHDIQARRRGGQTSTRWAASRLADESWMRERYVTEERTTASIAEELEVSVQTVADALERCGIPKRPTGNALRGLAARRLRDRAWMYQRLHVDQATYREVAEELNTTQRTVCNWLDKHGIPRRSKGKQRPAAAAEAA